MAFEAQGDDPWRLRHFFGCARLRMEEATLRLDLSAFGMLSLVATGVGTTVVWVGRRARMW